MAESEKVNSANTSSQHCPIHADIDTDTRLPPFDTFILYRPLIFISRCFIYATTLCLFPEMLARASCSSSVYIVHVRCNARRVSNNTTTVAASERANVLRSARVAAACRPPAAGRRPPAAAAEAFAFPNCLRKVEAAACEKKQLNNAKQIFKKIIVGLKRYRLNCKRVIWEGIRTGKYHINFFRLRCRE